MRAEQYVQQLLVLGERVHQHDGVWWRGQPHPYYKPALELDRITPRAARPSSHVALAGYSHIVPPSAPANGRRGYMILDRPQGEFDLSQLEKKKRNQVRKGLRECTIRPLTNIESNFPALQAINISVRERTGVGLPPSHYTEHEEQWRESIRRRFALSGHDWLGAFVGGELVGYYYGYAVGSTMTIDTAKVHSDALSFCASDALLFSIVRGAFKEKGTLRVVFGEFTPDDPDLSRFKEAHGFRRTEFPVYLSPTARILRLVVALLRRRGF